MLAFDVALFSQLALKPLRSQPVKPLVGFTSILNVFVIHSTGGDVGFTGRVGRSTVTVPGSQPTQERGKSEAITRVWKVLVNMHRKLHKQARGVKIFFFAPSLHMAQINPVSSLPADSVTTGAVQVTGTGLRISLRAYSGQTNLVLIRMNSSGKWFRCTDEFGDDANFILKASGSSSAGVGIADVSVTFSVKASNEYYHLLITSGSAFDGYAEILSVSDPNASGGVTSLVGAGGVSFSSPVVRLGGTDDMTLSTGALGWAGAAGKAATLVAGTGANARLDAGESVLVGTTSAMGVGIGKAAGALAVYSGTTTLEGKLAAGTAAWALSDPGDGGALPVGYFGNCAMTALGGATSRSIAAPSFVGQILCLSVATTGGTITVTASSAINQVGNTVMAFNSPEDSITLIGASVAGLLCWRVLANDGVTLL
jgi:hypothetical protein